MNDSLLQEQQAYYSARAAEYDQWWLREGRYDWGPERNAQWAAEGEQVRRLLVEREPVAETLELACGTGIWTRELIKISRHVTALDGSAEMLAINRAKLASGRAGCQPAIDPGSAEHTQTDQSVAESSPTSGPVSYQQADLFHWRPDRRFDLVFAGFFLSHVPPDRLASFLGAVAAALKPGGVFFFIDSRDDRTSMARDHERPERGDGTRRRRLADGREFTVVKVFHEPAELEAAFRAAGIQLKVGRTENYFLHGEGRRC